MCKRCDVVREWMVEMSWIWNEWLGSKCVGDKSTLCVSGVRECWRRIFGKDCRRFGGIGFDGFGLSGILI